MLIIVGLDSGCEKAVIPWGTIGSDQNSFIEDQFLPFGFLIQKDPSKMNKKQIETLLQYWHRRQNLPNVANAFRFRAYKDRSTGEIIVVDRKGKGKEKRKVTRKKQMKRAHIRNESDPEDGSNEDTASGDEEDLNDLTAPGPSKRRVGKIKSSKNSRVSAKGEIASEKCIYNLTHPISLQVGT